MVARDTLTVKVQVQVLIGLVKSLEGTAKWLANGLENRGNT